MEKDTKGALARNLYFVVVVALLLWPLHLLLLLHYFTLLLVVIKQHYPIHVIDIIPTIHEIS